MKVGFIGLGAMGLPMALTLVRAGFQVTGYDIVEACMARFRAEGGATVASVAEVAAGCDVLILMVMNDQQAAEVLRQGALDALRPPAVVALMATCPPPATVAIAHVVLSRGIGFLDAPVSGGVVGAERAALTLMVSGPDETLASVRPALEAMSSRLFHVGKQPGQGATAKTVNQLLCGVHLAAAAEALALARQAKIDLKIMLEIVSGSAASSWMIRDRGPRMLEEEPRVTSTVDIFVKDLGIVMQTGAAAKVALPLAAVAQQLFLSVSGQGKGNLDDSQIIEAYRNLNRAA